MISEEFPMSQPPGPPYQLPPTSESPTDSSGYHILPPPPPPSKKPKRFGWLAASLFALGGLTLGSIIGGGGDTSTTPAVTAPVESSQAGSEPDEPTEEPVEEPAPAQYTPKKSDWTLKVKTTDKQCFGSAGCNVSIKISPQYAGANKAAVPHEGTIDITYRVSGDESGPITGTATVELADGTVDTPEESLSTRSSSTKIAAAVTDVEYNEYG